MELFLLHHNEYARLYNCSVLTTEEWYAKGRPNPPLGVAIIVIGSVLLVPYVLCLYAILNSSLYRFSSYKIMIYLGISDIMCLSTNSVITGYATIVGAEACPYIDLQYVIGSLAAGMWASQCSSCVLLAFNRCVQFWNPKYLSGSFTAQRTYAWLALCTGYSIYVAWSTRGYVYSSIQYSWFANPYDGIPELSAKIDISEYISWHHIHMINNFVVTILLPLLYAFLLISVWLKKNEISSLQQGNTNIQTLVTIQSVFICLFLLLTAIVYMTIQFVELPLAVSVMVNIFWQLSNGSPALIYLILNKTIRRKVSMIVCRYKISKIVIPSWSSYRVNTP